jgi:hypothetical protein
MICYFENKKDAVQFVDDLRTAFPNVSPSITTILQEKSEAFAVTFATGSSLEGTDLERVAKNFFSTQANT